MIKYLQFGGVILFSLLLVLLTVFAIDDIVKNEMTKGDNFFNFIDYFKSEYKILYSVWTILGIILIPVIMYFVILMLRV